MKRRMPSVPWIHTLAVAAVLAGASLSCSDEPNAVGIEVLPPEDLVSIDTVVIREATSLSFKQFISPNDLSLLLGTYRGYEARTLVRFRSLPDSLRDAQVVSATLRMKPFYVFGDSMSTLSFNVYKILQSWSESSATWDSIVTAFYDPTPRGNFAQVVSDTTAMKLSFDPSLAQEWLIAAADSTDQFGMLLLPAPGQSVIKGFASFRSSLPPTLDIIYEKSGRVDTLIWSLGYDVYVANVDLPSNPELMYVQAGVTYRTRLWFDVSMIPADAIIHNATLELTINRSASELGGMAFDSVFVYHVSDSSNNEFEASGIVLSRGVKDNPDLLEVNVTRNAQRWVLGESNEGFLLRAYAESNQLDLIALFSPEAPEVNNRPRLKITYSEARRQ